MTEKKRCHWGTASEKMMSYHDEIWGVPEFDDQKLFAKLILDMNQAGLSWNTILNKWESFESAYDGFSIEKVAAFTPEKVAALMEDPGIIRNRRKIEAAVNNAQKVLQLQAEFGSFSNYLWKFTGGQPQVNYWETEADVPANSPLSDAISKDLKRRGFKFIGTTIIYAFLQAVGIINDHTIDCFRHDELLTSWAHSQNTEQFLPKS